MNKISFGQDSARKTIRKGISGFAALTIAFQWALAAFPPASSAATPLSVTITGYVKNMVTGIPISGAMVKILDRNVSMTADSQGNLRAETLLLPENTEHISLTIEAKGYKKEQSEIRVFPDAKIKVTGQLIESRNTSEVVVSKDAAKLGTRTASTFSAQASGAALPQTIKVWRKNSTNEVVVVPFNSYVKHVLPSEWIGGWPMDSLKSGAMCVKAYAWYWVLNGSRYSNGADVRDDACDQVYDPNYSYYATDDAVDATWNYEMTRDNVIPKAQYVAGQKNATGYDPDYKGRLTQWGSEYWARQGKDWQWILHYYYGPSLGFWKNDIAVTLKSPYKSQLKAGERLAPKKSLTSADGRFTLVYQGDENLVLYRNRDHAALWCSKSKGTEPGYTIMQADGNLVAFNANRVAKWASWTHGHQGSRLIVQNDGNTVIYDSANKPLWATGTNGKY